MRKSAPIEREIAWVTVGSLAFALCFFYRLLPQLSQINVPVNSGRLDWDLAMEFHWAAAYSITHFHQFPFWNPYKCGGIPLFADPQSAVLTPFLLLDLLFGPEIGVNVYAIAHAAIAFGGAYFLGRVLGIGKLGAVGCAVAFAGSAWFYMDFEWGEINYLTFAYAPWAIGLFWLGVERQRQIFAAAGALMLALILMEGAVYQLIFTMTMIAVLAMAIAYQRGNWFPLRLLAITGAFTAGFVAIKLLPGVAYTGMHSTVRDTSEVFALQDLLLALFSRDRVTWHAYIGIIIAGLALLGSALRFRRALPWIIVAGVALVLAKGDFGPWSPWVLIHRLPFYSSTRFPERWLTPLTLAVGVLAGFGADAISAVKKPWGGMVAGLLIGLALVDNWYVTQHAWMHFLLEGNQPFAHEVQPEPTFHQLYVPDSYFGYWGPPPGTTMVTTAKANKGLIVAWDTPGIVQGVSALAPNQTGYRGEQYLLGNGDVTLVRWTPNALSFDLDVPASTTLVVNQNYYQSWHLARGQGKVISLGADSRIGVLVPAQKQRIVVSYRSWPFLIGLWITLGTLVAMLALWRHEWRIEP
jgi:hypothetical protein